MGCGGRGGKGEAGLRIRGFGGVTESHTHSHTHMDLLVGWLVALGGAVYYAAGLVWVQ